MRTTIGRGRRAFITSATMCVLLFYAALQVGCVDADPAPATERSAPDWIQAQHKTPQTVEWIEDSEDGAQVTYQVVLDPEDEVSDESLASVEVFGQFRDDGSLVIFAHDPNRVFAPTMVHFPRENLRPVSLDPTAALPVVAAGGKVILTVVLTVYTAYETYNNAVTLYRFGENSLKLNSDWTAEVCATPREIVDALFAWGSLGTAAGGAGIKLLAKAGKLVSPAKRFYKAIGIEFKPTTPLRDALLETIKIGLGEAFKAYHGRSPGQLTADWIGSEAFTQEFYDNQKIYFRFGTLDLALLFIRQYLNWFTGAPTLVPALEIDYSNLFEVQSACPAEVPLDPIGARCDVEQPGWYCSDSPDIAILNNLFTIPHNVLCCGGVITQVQSCGTPGVCQAMDQGTQDRCLGNGPPPTTCPGSYTPSTTTPDSNTLAFPFAQRSGHPITSNPAEHCARGVCAGNYDLDCEVGDALLAPFAGVWRVRRDGIVGYVDNSYGNEGCVESSQLDLRACYAHVVAGSMADDGCMVAQGTQVALCGRSGTTIPLGGGDGSHVDVRFERISTGEVVEPPSPLTWPLVPALPASCSMNQPTCIPTASTTCVGARDVYTVDSCGEADDHVTTCDGACLMGACSAACTPEAALVCQGSRSHWIDACGALDPVPREHCAFGCDPGTGTCFPDPTNPCQATTHWEITSERVRLIGLRASSGSFDPDTTIEVAFDTTTSSTPRFKLSKTFAGRPNAFREDVNVRIDEMPLGQVLFDGTVDTAGRTESSWVELPTLDGLSFDQGAGLGLRVRVISSDQDTAGWGAECAHQASSDGHCAFTEPSEQPSLTRTCLCTQAPGSLRCHDDGSPNSELKVWTADACGEPVRVVQVCDTDELCSAGRCVSTCQDLGEQTCSSDRREIVQVDSCGDTLGRQPCPPDPYECQQPQGQAPRCVNTCPDWALESVANPSCDGLDNDCDGVVDEGCACHYLQGQRALVGVCQSTVAEGTQAADPNGCARPDTFIYEELVANSGPNQPLRCDGLDNDCDGVVDEGCVFCGNGVVDGPGEACDDGNTVNGDGCSRSCLIELGSQGCDADAECDGQGVCNPARVCVIPNACGNGIVEAEACDDGNAFDGDGCSRSCLIELGAACNLDAQCQTGSCEAGACVCTATQGCAGSLVCDLSEIIPTCEPSDRCGNGLIEAGEACDDGGLVTGDGCSSSCRVESGFACARADMCASGICTAGTCMDAGICGNGVVETGEACDDANTTSGDGCAGCKRELGRACAAGSECVTGVCHATSRVCVQANACGNSVIEGLEVCDDGNTVDDDGCDSGCALSTGQACTGDAMCASSLCFGGTCTTRSQLAGTVGAGATTLCVLDASNKAVCSGSNDRGAASVPDVRFDRLYAAPSGLTCGKRSSDGQTFCFGQPSGPATPNVVPAPTDDFEKVVYSKHQHACGLRADGVVVCWGANDHGQTQVPAGTYRDVSVGDGYTCAVRDDGSLSCWGNLRSSWSPMPQGNDFVRVASETGAMGNVAMRADGTLVGWTQSGGIERTPAGTFTDLVSMRSGFCALRTNGLIECWTADSYTPPPPPAGTFVALAPAIHQDVCAISTQGEVVCWGRGNSWRHGIPNTITDYALDTSDGRMCTLAAGQLECDASFNIPREPFPNLGVRDPVVSYTHTCAIAATSGSLVCAGENTWGATDVPANLGPVQQVAVSYGETCALTSSGEITCWGGNPNTSTVFATSAPTGNGFSSMSSYPKGGFCALRAGRLECWGDSRLTVPANLPDLANIRVGATHACGLTLFGSEIACIGANPFGEATPPAGTYKEVDAGLNYSCAIDSADQIRCWGINDHRTSSPPQGAFYALETAGEFACARRLSDSELVCWGDHVATNIRAQDALPAP